MQQEEPKKLKRIKQISVKNLFGIFNHTIPLNMDERITIIHGPNGFGKTMMLQLLYALFRSNNQLFRDIPFDEFRIDYEDNSSLWISQTKQLSESPVKKPIDEREIVFHATDEKPYSLHADLAYTMGSGKSQAMLYIAKYIVNQQMSLLDDVNEELSSPLPTSSEDEITGIPVLPAWLIEMRSSIPIHFIETQRLVDSTRPALSVTTSARLSRRETDALSGYAVTADSEHLTEIIEKKLAESASLSQSLDRSFPVRLISPTNQQLQLEEAELRDKLIKLEKKRERLMATGLLDPETGPTFPVNARDEQKINPNTKAVLAVYVEDTEQKLGIFDELAQKIGLLTTIINSRFLYKTLTIDKERGLIFTSKNGTILPLETLSSGEQHELVLFYELLFRTNPGSLILIDEPELSLHVVWQEQFLKDIQQVAHLTNIDIILATHSPDIINDRRDLVVELEGPKNGRI